VPDSRVLARHCPHDSIRNPIEIFARVFSQGIRVPLCRKSARKSCTISNIQTHDDADFLLIKGSPTAVNARNDRLEAPSAAKARLIFPEKLVYNTHIHEGFEDYEKREKTENRTGV
jgi:hypothetical protein